MWHPKSSLSFYLTDPITLTDYIMHYEYSELRNFVHLHFYNKNAPFQVLNLKELAQCRILIVLVIKRINLIVDLQLGMEEMTENPEPNQKILRHSNLVKERITQ